MNISEISRVAPPARDRLELIATEGKCKGTDSDFYAEVVSYEVRLMCDTCPVEQECLEYALHYEQYGYWGGATSNERTRMRKSLNIRINDIYVQQPKNRPAQNATTITDVCGTPGTTGWRAHKKRNEAPCDACLTNYSITREAQQAARKNSQGITPSEEAGE